MLSGTINGPSANLTNLRNRCAFLPTRFSSGLVSWEIWKTWETSDWPRSSPCSKPTAKVISCAKNTARCATRGKNSFWPALPFLTLLCFVCFVKRQAFFENWIFVYRAIRLGTLLVSREVPAHLQFYREVIQRKRLILVVFLALELESPLYNVTSGSTCSWGTGLGGNSTQR